MENLSDLEIGWIAGFLEGEGSFQYRSSALVSASQVQKEPLERLEKMLGGRIIIAKDKRPNNSQLYQWYLNSESSMQLMNILYKYMSPRRQEQIMYCFQRAEQKQIRTINGIPVCKRGHPMVGENIYVHKSLTKNGTVSRMCKTCALMRSKLRYTKEKTTQLSTVISTVNFNPEDMDL